MHLRIRATAMDRVSDVEHGRRVRGAPERRMHNVLLRIATRTGFLCADVSPAWVYQIGPSEEADVPSRRRQSEGWSRERNEEARKLRGTISVQS